MLFRSTQGYKFDLKEFDVYEEDIYLPAFTYEDEYNPEVNIKSGDTQIQYAINISSKDLEQIFDNIISNAVKYGFTDSNIKDYIIKIEISESDEFKLKHKDAVSIKISNNGDPLSQGMDRSKFFHWGVGHGTGLGTWQIKNIVEHFGGKVRLNEYPNDPNGFQIEYELIFPLTNRL